MEDNDGIDPNNRNRLARRLTGPTGSAGALVPRPGIAPKSMAPTLLTDPVFAMIVLLDALRLNYPRRFGFDNTPHLQYNPLYIRSAAPALASVRGAV